MLDSQLKSNIKKLWLRFHSGGITNPLQAIEQMSYLIFMKKLEDEDDKKVRKALEKYCELDTMAEIKIVERMGEMV